MTDGAGRAALTAARPPVSLRAPQQHALDALERYFAEGHRRAWLVLPPGMGKTLTGLEAARRRGSSTVVLGPNTAIQAQWRREWDAYRPAPPPASTDRSLDAPLTVLTYQSLASFDPEAETDEEGGQGPGARDRTRTDAPDRTGHTRPTRRTAPRHLLRLRPQGRELVEALRAAGDVTLVLDECHHLLDTWGELLAELLRELPEAVVIGLTATPPDRLTPAQAELVEELFGPAVQGPSIPAGVREGHLAPYAELAWVTEPTVEEAEWLAGEAGRFAELTTDLLDPDFAAVPFLAWLDERVVRRSAGTGAAPGAVALPWYRFARERPELADAALRLHHHGLLALPDGARLREEHRHAPTADDWVRLLDDWVRHCLRGSDDPRDLRALDAVRTALPSLGHQLTARGIRSGRSPVDRVLARSAAKSRAVREILAAESDALRDRLRATVLCDHERATATLPARLTGVLDAQAGSARLLLAELCADARTAALSPLLVTGRTVAAARGTAERFARFCADRDPSLRFDPLGGATEAPAADGEAPVELTGNWTSRRWVALATRFFESGGTRAFLGTRALLGEGWDARGVNTLVDLTEATTAAAVVQTRGRALRTDPRWPEKTAHTWSVVCVAPDHPRGNADWDRFVRKHDGYLGVTDSGDIMAGVAHVHPGFSPYAPPPAGEFARYNAHMLDRARDRATVRELWRIGAPYEDSLVHTVRVIGGGAGGTAGGAGGSGGAGAAAAADGARDPARTDGRHAPVPPAARPAARGITGRAPQGRTPAVTGAVAVLTGPGGALAGAATGAPAPASAVLAGAAAVVLGWSTYVAGRSVGARRLLDGVAAEPVLPLLACAVADGLHAAGRTSRGAGAVTVEPDGTGAYHVRLDGVPTADSACFATAFDEVVAAPAAPRYLLPRHILPATGPGAGLRAGLRAVCGRSLPNAVVHHTVPGVVGGNRKLVDRYVRGWNRWIGPGEPLYVRDPRAAGVLAAQAGRSPLDVTTALRTAWR